VIVGGWWRRAEWVVEAYLRFGGIGSRLHAAAAEQGGFGLHFALVDELRALNGPTLCRPCTIGVRTPELDLWWLVLPVLVASASWRPGGRATHQRTAGGRVRLCLAAQYLFMIDYAAPRFLLPAYALLSIPVPTGWPLPSPESAGPAVGHDRVVTCFLVLQLFTQHLVLDHEVGGTVRFHDDYTRIAAVLAAGGSGHRA